jgi:asparagine synthase (glutamine-hydrolysing)
LDGSVGLGHRRLAILDLQGGPQPMANETRRVWVVFNGEIYNFNTLRTTLQARGHSFRSHSDTEVILHLYEEYGEECVCHLRGMFAFALWDADRRRLLLARDRLGIKPLYYVHTQQALLFASEMKALLADAAVPRTVDEAAVRRSFAFRYLPGDGTLFAGIRKLPPGHTLLVENGRVAAPRRYWDLSFPAVRSSLSFGEAAVRLRDLLRDAVVEHLQADVPVGVLLSGGLDSTAVLALAAGASRGRLRTFTVGFAGAGDERPFAREAAARFGAEHHEMTLNAHDFWNHLPVYAWHMEEPVHEPPAIAMHHVARLAHDRVKVLLSGEGGDEAFAGYPEYPRLLQLERIARWLGPARHAVARLGAAAAQALEHDGLARYSAALGLPVEQHYFSRASGPTMYFNAHADAVLQPDFLRATANDAATRLVRDCCKTAAAQPLLDRLLYIDTKTWLPDDLLIKADRMTMANSVELRVPLLDHRILEFAASLRPEFKVRGHETKRILRAAVGPEIPREILQRPKAGFPVPYRGWLRGELRHRVEDLLLPADRRVHRYVRPAAITHLLRTHAAGRDHGPEIFSLIALELWHRVFLN